MRDMVNLGDWGHNNIDLSGAHVGLNDFYDTVAKSSH